MTSKIFLAAIILMSICGCQTMKTTSARNSLDIQGHRGARSVRPENTIPAFQYAIDVGVDTLELDTVVTKDNVVVLHHDLYLNPVICRTAKGGKISGKIAVRNVTLADLKKYDCGSVVNPRFPRQVTFPGTAIPTLEEVFIFVKGYGQGNAAKVKFNIETKSDPKQPGLQPEPAVFAKLILDLAKKHKLDDRITIQSFDHRTLQAAKKISPNTPRAALFEYRPSDVLKATLAAEGTIFSPNHEWLVEEDVERLQEAGIPVIPWTANEKKEWERLLRLQVNGIITDDPAALIEFLTATIRRDDPLEYSCRCICL